MTVTLLRPYATYPANTVVTLPDDTESALITQGIATRFAITAKLIPSAIAGTAPPNDADGQPDGTTYVQTGAGTYVKTGGKYITPISDDEPRAYRVGLFGDSIAAWRETQIAVPGTITDNTDGTCLLSFVGDKGFYAGDPIRITAATDRKFNVMDGIVASATGTGPINVFFGSGRTSPVIGGVGAASVSRVMSQSACGFLPVLETLVKQKLDVTTCCAGGAKAADVIDMMAQTNLSKSFLDLAVLMVGTNNLYAGGQTAAQVIVEFGPLLDRMAVLGCPVAVFMVPPRTSLTTPAIRNNHAQFNRWLWDECVRRGFRPVDSYRASFNSTTFIDSSSGTGAPSANVLQADGTHPETLGGLMLGTALFNATSDLFTSRSWTVSSPALVVSANNFLTAAGVDIGFAAAGGTATPGGGVITGAVPAGFTLQHTSGTPTVTTTLTARTVAADGDAFGNKYTMVFSNITGSTNTRFFKAGLQAQFTAGQKIKIRIPFQCTSLVNCVNLSAIFFPTFPDGFIHSTNIGFGNISTFAGTFGGVWESPPVTIPVGGLTAADIRLNMGFASGGSGTVEIWQPEILLDV